MFDTNLYKCQRVLFLSIKLYLVLLVMLWSAVSRADTQPWQTCIAPSNLETVIPSSPISLNDRFDRSLTGSFIPLMDWEGFIQNPQFQFQITPPEDINYPITIEVSADNAPRIYIFQMHEGEDPYDIRDFVAMQNENGPMWGSSLHTLDDVYVYGGVSHDLTTAELLAIGLERQVRQFNQSDFPLNLNLGIHPDRDGEDESYVLNIVMTGSDATKYELDAPVVVCDQDQPERAIDFKFHIDYSTDWDGYIENTADGAVIKQSYEQVLDDVAYFFQDMRFDTMEVGQCSTFVNWVVEDKSGFASNTYDYDNGFYLFINSHSGGGGLASETLHTRDGKDTDFPACGYWGTNLRDDLSQNVSNRIYVPEDDWWRVNNTMIYGQDGECLGDSLGDPNNGCIECPNDEAWCPHLRGDIYWPNLHELNHGLTLGTSWPRWKQWMNSDSLCADDEALTLYTGTCVPMYKTDHIVGFGLNTESNQPADVGRTLFSKLDIMLMQAVGWEMRETTMMVPVQFVSDSLVAGTLNSIYDNSIEIKGGVPSYQFELITGHLPPGLTLNSFDGRIQGTPTQAGEYTFTVLIKDSSFYHALNSNGVTKEFKVLINE